MNEAMLKEIITRILSSPELQSLLTISSQEQGAKPGCLILLNNQEAAFELHTLENRYGQDYSLRVCVVGPVEFADKKIPRVSYEQAISEWHWARLHIPVCSADQLAQMALGLCTDLTSKMAAWAITAGIPVEIGRMNWGFTAKTPEKYRQMFENYACQLAGFGVMIAEHSFPAKPPVPVSGQPASLHRPVPVTEKPAELQSQMPLESQATAAVQAVQYDKRLLTNKEAGQIQSNQVLRIAKSTVLTPSAIDTLKKQKVEVYREGVRCF